MQVSSLSIVNRAKRAVVRLGMLPVFFALMAGVCLGQVEKRGGRVTAGMASCLGACDGPACMRDCVAGTEIPLGRDVRIEAEPHAVLLGCFSEQIDNINSCGRGFLVPADDADLKHFWVCVDVATKKFLQCPAFEVSSSPAATAMLGSVMLEGAIQVAESTIALASGGKLDPLPRATEAATGDVEASDGGDPVPDEEKTFEQCNMEFAANIASCVRVHAGDPTNQQACEDVAKKVFEACAGVGGETE